MISVEEARKLVLTHVEPAVVTETDLHTALGCTLAADIKSPINMPPFRQSAMDGYAVHLHDSLSYSLIDEVKAGDGHRPVLRPGEAVRIFTGAPVPDTANAVVMQEKVVKEDKVIVLSNIPAQDINIRPIAEQVARGAVALTKGTRLIPAAIGYLASLGITRVPVYKKPSIAIVTTGNELADPGTSLPYGKVYESNALMLQSALYSLGYNKITIHKVADHYEHTRALLQHTIRENNLVLITGGISVGDYDFVGRALSELEVHQVFYKVKQKPGKPLYFGRKESSIIFALPGNPAAALSCFYIYVYTALKRLSGDPDCNLPLKKARALNSFVKKGDRPQFLKSIVHDGQVEILEGQSSAMLQTFALANALVYMPEKTTKISVGDEVQLVRLPI